MTTPYYLHDHPEMIALRAQQADEFHDLAERHSMDRLALQKSIRREQARNESQTKEDPCTSQ